MSNPWNKKTGVMQYKGADWSGLLTVRHNQTVEQAQSYAIANDIVTYFCHVVTPISLPPHGTFIAGDALFFSGTPHYGDAEWRANSYEKVYSTGISTSVPPGNGFTFFQASMITPTMFAQDATHFFLWIGLEPGSVFQCASYEPVGNGVLQPVLTWGANWAPPFKKGQIPPDYQGWWISGQYVNTSADCWVPKFKNCWFSGDPLLLNAGDQITTTMSYDATTQTWLQTVLNNTTSAQVEFPISLVADYGDQQQNLAFLVPEYSSPAFLNQAFSFFDITIRVSQPDAALGQDIASLSSVIGLQVNLAQTELTIERAIVYSPVSMQQPPLPPHLVRHPIS